MSLPVPMVFSSVSAGLMSALSLPSAVVAQESVTSNSIRITIGALLIIAALLMVLTIWFWRYTNPKKRLPRAASAPVATATPNTAGTRSSGSAASSDPTASPRTAATSAAAPASATPDEVAQLRAALGIADTGGAKPSSEASGTSWGSAAADSDDDWLRLTGPDALPPRSRKPGTPSS